MTKKCPECDNEYLAVRTDIYKDKRKFVYCDCCGFLLQEKSWYLVHNNSKLDSIMVEAETNQKWAFLEWRTKAEELLEEQENLRKANLHCVDMFNMLKADYDKLREAATSLLKANSYYFPEGNPWGDRLKALLKE